MSTAEHMDNGVHEADEALRRRAGQLQKFFDDVEELLQQVAGIDDKDIKRLRDRVEKSITSARVAIREGAQAAYDGTRRAAKATDTYVHENPWTAIGIGTATGLLVGALLRSSRH